MHALSFIANSTRLLTLCVDTFTALQCSNTFQKCVKGAVSMATTGSHGNHSPGKSAGEGEVMRGELGDLG